MHVICRLSLNFYGHANVGIFAFLKEDITTASFFGFLGPPRIRIFSFCRNLVVEIRILIFYRIRQKSGSEGPEIT